MNNYFSFLTRNWGLKLLALILALVVFYGVRSSTRGHRVTGRDTPGFFMKGSTNAAPAAR